MSALCGDPRETAKGPLLRGRHVIYAALVGVCISASLCLHGCGTVPKVRYYAFDPAGASATADTPSDGPVLRVERFSVADPYADRRMVYRENPREVGFWDFHLWAEPLDRMITARVAERLVGTGAFKRVDSFPYTWERADLVLRGAVLAFEEVDKEDGWYGRVKIVFELLDPVTGDALWSDKLEVQKVAQRRTPSAVVGALSAALDEAVNSAGAGIKAAVERTARTRADEEAP